MADLALVVGLRVCHVTPVSGLDSATPQGIAMKNLQRIVLTLVVTLCTNSILADEGDAAPRAATHFADVALVAAVAGPVVPQPEPPQSSSPSSSPPQSSSHSPPPTSDRPTVLLVVGAAGTEEYGTAFQQWAKRWQKVADDGAADFQWIGPGGPDTPTESPTDREQLKAAVELASSSKAGQPLWVIYIGHGTFDQQVAALNLRGPDISAEDLAALLKPVPRPLVIAICASSSAPFINSLSGPGRVIISATKDGNQVQYSRFGDAFSLAVGGLDADVDRDGQTSLLEAWLFASRRTAEFYVTEGRLATEHSLLEDNGDGRGVRAELFDGLKLSVSIQSDEPVDGANAGKIWLIRSAEERQLTADQQLTRDALEARLESLKVRRGEIDEADYLQQLEEVLLPLSKLYHEAEERITREPAAP